MKIPRNIILGILDGVVLNTWLLYNQTTILYSILLRDFELVFKYGA